MRKTQYIVDSNRKEVSPELYRCAIQNVRQQIKNLPQSNYVDRDSV